MRSHRAARARLCVAISDVNPCVRCSRSNNSNTAQAFCSSKSPVGSSASSTAGPVTSARAIATRCCSPPESSPARWSARFSRPTSASHFRAVPSAEVKSSPRNNSGMATFSAAVKSGNNWWRCQRKPTARFRNSASAASSSFVSMALFAKYTVPLVGVSSAASKCKRVLLPAPDGATMATISPWCKLRFASDKTARLFSPLP